MTNRSARLMLLWCIVMCLAVSPVTAEEQPPNVLLIAVDDLNDWIGCLGGHPQARTPNMDRLAERGVLFTNAHCQSPVCNPSRASMMTSLYPETTGIYFLNPPIAKSEVASNATVMPRRFVEAGYEVIAAGKLFHHTENQVYFQTYGGSFGGFGPLPKEKLAPYPGHPLWDWGAHPGNDEKMPDYKIASWAEEQLAKSYDKPLFVATGFYRPHVPHFAPKKWMDLFPLDEVRLPVTAADDLDDLSEYAINLTRLKHVAPPHEWVVENDEWRPLVQTYLACVAFVDAQVGRVLDALDKSAIKDNTYVVLYSDHGFELGEKERWAKRSLWENSTNVPMIIMGPGIEGGRVCHKPVELIDIYPTLLDLTGQEADPQHEGQSLVPLLKDPKAAWPHPARTSFGPGNVAIKSERYRYIRYVDGSEEFYDHKTDPHELTNLIKDASLAKLIDAHREHLPTVFHPVLGQNSTGHKAFIASGERIGNKD
ncbi:MAG: sulfatase [Planctomycetota bacterium]